MKKISRYLSALLILALSACATVKTPDMLSPQAAGIGISVDISAIFSQKPDVVYFAKLSDREQVLSQYPLLRSNYVKGYDAFLLNAEPGIYVAVAASYSQFIPASSSTSGSMTVTAGGGAIGRVVYFPMDLIKKTLVEVKPGAISYMGTYEVGMAMMGGFSNADKAQEHYRGQLVTGTGSTFECTIKKSLRDAESERAFLEKAREDFKESAWEKLVN